MLNVTHNTTNYTIEAASRDELKSALLSFGENASEINKMSKAERVEAVKVYRDRLQSAAFDAAEKLENARLAQLEIDKRNETFNAVKVAYAKCLATKIATAEVKLAGIQKQINEAGPHGMMYVMKNYMDDVFSHSFTLRAIAPVFEYVNGQTTEPTHTMEQFVQFMVEDADRAMERVIQTTCYQHRSSGILSNMEGEFEFKNAQEMAKFTRAAVKAIKADLASGETEPAMMNCSHVYAW